mmetsp:Transcript_61106/g.164220  ORF Transcript_61106/g.164220 Transcript_61106/m.164220 type:complete len:348 (+) Transcript_61106:300-1343(+)
MYRKLSCLSTWRDNFAVADTLAGGISCVIVEQGWAVIATRRVRINGMESGADGSIVYSLKSNKRIQNISDLVGKRLGAGFILSATTYQSGYQLLAENSVHLLKDVNQVILYGNDFERQFQDVLSGRIDAGFVSSTWLAQNHPKEEHLLLVHRQLYPSYEGEVFPFTTSAPLVPQYGLASSELVHWQLKSEVAEALQNLEPTHPAAVAASLEGFTGPGTYADVETTQKTMKIIFRDAQNNLRCSNQWSVKEIWDSFDCVSIPGGDFIKVPFDEAVAKCNSTHVPCPDGLNCFCQPCIPDPEVNFFNWQLVLAMCIAIYSVGISLALILQPRLDPFGLFGDLPKGRRRA